MEEKLSWRARLAKSNINILSIDFTKSQTKAIVFYEFMYHPKAGQTKWCKTYARVEGAVSGDIDSGYFRDPVYGRDIYDTLSTEVLALRKELEA